MRGMKPNPVRIVVSGYVLSLLAASVGMALGMGWLGGVLAFWLGGAVATLGLAVIAPEGGWLRPVVSGEDDSADSLRRWEADRLHEGADEKDRAAARRD